MSHAANKAVAHASTTMDTHRYLFSPAPFVRGLVSAAVATLAIGATSVSAQIPDRIKIGQLVSLTGGAASANAVMVAGVKLAVAELNKAGGIAGKPVDLIVADDQSDPTAAVNSARRLATLEKVHVVIGPNISQFALASAPVFNESKTASIAVSGSTALTPQTANYLFSYAPPGDVAARAMVAYAQDTLKAKSIAYIGDNGAQAKIAAEAIKAEAAKRKLTITATQEYEFRATDITPQMLALRRTNPDVLLMWPGVGEDHGLIVKTASDLNWKVRIVNGQATPLHIAAGKKVFADAFKDVASPLPKSWTYCPNEAVGSGALPKFADRLKAAEGENYARLSPLYAAWAYDSVMLAKAAIEGARSVDGVAITRWIEQNAKSFKGVSGPIEASSTDHFLASASDSLVMAVDTDKPRADGLFLRASGC